MAEYGLLLDTWHGCSGNSIGGPGDGERGAMFLLFSFGSFRDGDRRGGSLLPGDLHARVIEDCILLFDPSNFRFCLGGDGDETGENIRFLDSLLCLFRLSSR